MRDKGEGSCMDEEEVIQIGSFVFLADAEA